MIWIQIRAIMRRIVKVSRVLIYKMMVVGSLTQPLGIKIIELLG